MILQEGGAAAEKAQKRFERASESMTTLSAWDADTMAKRVIENILPKKFENDLERKVAPSLHGKRGGKPTFRGALGN